MIRGQCGIRCSARKRYLYLLLVDHKFAFCVAAQDAANVTDIMQEAGAYEMGVIVGLNLMG